jgi:hypothetical protein
MGARGMGAAGTRPLQSARSGAPPEMLLIRNAAAKAWATRHPA